MAVRSIAASTPRARPLSPSALMMTPKACSTELYLCWAPTGLEGE